MGRTEMSPWLKAALDYVPQWIEFQVRLNERPGCAVAIVHRGKVVLDCAFGFADAVAGVPLTPRHRFRVASHSKSFTAAGIMKLRDQNKLGLDDAVGQYVDRLHPAVAAVTISQLLSHSAGLVRDGLDSGQWLDRRPFADADKIRADLADGPTIEPNSRFKYSNHGFALLGFVIEAITGEAYTAWIRRAIVDAAGLTETEPDAGLPHGGPLAGGHSARLPLGRRVVIPGDNPTHALASATGFVSTAADLARFFNQLSPAAESSVVSVAGRREMIRRQWREAHATLERYYGLGTISGTLGGWEWFGHSGGFQGFITRTVTVPAHELTVSVLTNSSDGLADTWLDGTLHILRGFAERGPPSRGLADWNGRWWTLTRVVDLVAAGDRLLAAMPALPNPFMDASEIETSGRDHGRIALAAGFANQGEPVRRVRGRDGKVAEIWFAGMKMLDEAGLTREMEERYDGRKPARGKR
jgi:CubicO group peptidase (beta-lactamase class C family)